MTEPIRVSASLYSLYRKCPQQALARHQGVYGKGSMASLKGGLAHKVFAEHLEGRPIEDDVFAQRCRELVGEHMWGPMGDVNPRPSEFNAMVSEVKDLYDRFRQLPTDGFVAAEKEVDAGLDDGTTLVGRVDAVFERSDGTVIVDWKTGSYLDDSDAQLDFYALAWKLVNGAPPSSVEAASLATGEQYQRHPDTTSLAATEAEVREMVTAIRAAVEAMTELERRGGPHCRWCPLLDDCSEGSTAVELLE